MHPTLIAALAAERQADLLRAAERQRLLRAASAGSVHPVRALAARARSRTATALAGLRAHAAGSRAVSPCCA